MNNQIKNILIGSPSPPDSGSGISTYSKELAEAITNFGITVHYLSPEPLDHTWLNKLNIKFIPSNHDGDPVEICKDIIKYISNNNIQSVINNDNPFLKSIFPALTCPAITIGHMNKRTIPKVACHLNKWTDYIVTISNEMHYSFIHKYKAPITKTVIIYNGINDHNDEIIYSRPDTSKINVLFSGGYSKIKGSDLLLSSIEKYPEVWEKTNLHWFGKVPKKIKKKCEKYNIIFHGRVTRDVLLEQLKKSDVFLLPSRLEGCPMTLIEAMSYGVAPITSTGEGAMRYMVNSGVNGYICHLNHWAEQSASYIEYLHNNENILIDMKKSSRSNYVDNFQAKFVAENLLHLLKTPTVDRSTPLKRINSIKWHRPTKPKKFINRINWKLEKLTFTEYFDV